MPEVRANVHESKKRTVNQKYDFIEKSKILILTKLGNDWVKIVDFLTKAYFRFTVRFLTHTLG